jgi:hypothetical protein
MNLRLISGLILLTAPAIAQQTPGGVNRSEAFKGMTKKQVMEATADANKAPKLLGAEYFIIVPQVADGLQAGQGVWTTVFHVVNLDWENNADFELDFYNQSGTAASIGIVCPASGSINGSACTAGAVTSMTSITGTLDKGQVLSYSTGGLPAVVQSYWATLNVNTSGAFTSVFETINLFNAAANYLASESGPSDYGVQNTANIPGLYLPFDNTNTNFTTAAFANPDFENSINVNSLEIYFVNSAGALFDTETYTVPPGTQTAIVIANQWPKTADIAGTMYIVPYTPAAGGNAASFPTFSPITILALQSQSTQNGAGFSHTDAFVPLLAIGCYTGTGC